MNETCKPCGCRDCPFEMCACGEDHASCPGGMCRDCYHESLFKSIADHEAVNPGSLEERAKEVAKLFAGKRRRK